MLPKENRLTKRDDFSKVYKDGRHFCYENIIIKFLKTNSTKIRIGFSVGKNVSKLAVKRNSLRRILREATRKQLSNFKSGLDIIVMIQTKNKSLHSLTTKNIEQNIAQVFLKTNLFK